MGAIKLGRYPGKANSAYGVKWFMKHSMGRIVGRLPGVLRRSEKVLARNEKVRASPPAKACEGKPWDEFVTCLAEEMPA